jgi:hypothetical protein
MKRYLAILLLIGLPYCILGFDNNDTQVWSGTTIELIQDNFYYYLSEQVKWGGEISDLYLHRTDGGVGYEVSSSVSASLNYKLVNIEKNSIWESYNVPYLNLNFSKELNSLEVSSRSRFEYWDSSNQTDYWRYRNRIKVEPLWISKDFPLSTYIAEEIFVKFNNEKITTLRTYLGVDWELFDQVEIGLFYCLQQSDGGNTWKNSHAFCSSVKFIY